MRSLAFSQISQCRFSTLRSTVWLRCKGKRQSERCRLSRARYGRIALSADAADAGRLYANAARRSGGAPVLSSLLLDVNDEDRTPTCNHGLRPSNRSSPPSPSSGRSLDSSRRWWHSRAKRCRGSMPTRRTLPSAFLVLLLLYSRAHTIAATLRERNASCSNITLPSRAIAG